MIEIIDGVKINTTLFDGISEVATRNLFPEKRDPVAVARIQRILDQLQPYTTIPAPKLIYTFTGTPVDMYGHGNAAASPTGEIIVTEQLHNTVKADGTLAVILGHEMGHLYRKDSWRKVAAIAKMFRTDNVTTALQASLLINFTRMNPAWESQVDDRTKHQEPTADEYGATLAFKAGFPFDEIAGFVTHLKQARQDENRIKLAERFIDQFRITKIYS